MKTNHSSQPLTSYLHLCFYCFMKLNSSACSFPAVILICFGPFFWLDSQIWSWSLILFPAQLALKCSQTRTWFSTLPPWAKADFLSQSCTESLFMKIFCSLCLVVGRLHQRKELKKIKIWKPRDVHYFNFSNRLQSTCKDGVLKILILQQVSMCTCSSSCVVSVFLSSLCDCV